MKVQIHIALALLAFSCNESMDSEAYSNSISEETTNEDRIVVNEDSIALPNNVFPEAILDDPCLPYPDKEFLDRLEKNSLSHFYSDESNVLYNYLVAHFDSLSPRFSYDVIDKYDMGTYHWKQDFTNGLSFDEIFGGEVGAIATLHTKCSDKTAIVSTLNALLNYKRVIPEGEWDDNGIWNGDSTEFSPRDAGVGCYYEVIKNDSTGYYSVENYCGC